MLFTEREAHTKSSKLMVILLEFFKKSKNFWAHSYSRLFGKDTGGQIVRIKVCFPHHYSFLSAFSIDITAPHLLPVSLKHYWNLSVFHTKHLMLRNF